MLEVSEKQGSEELPVLSLGTKAGLYVQPGYDKVIVSQEGKMHIAARGRASKRKDSEMRRRYNQPGWKQESGRRAVESPGAPTFCCWADRKQG